MKSSSETFRVTLYDSDLLGILRWFTLDWSCFIPELNLLRFHANASKVGQSERFLKSRRKASGTLFEEEMSRQKTSAYVSQ